MTMEELLLYCNSKTNNKYSIKGWAIIADGHTIKNIAALLERIELCLMLRHNISQATGNIPYSREY